jgi:hypothetical protein
MPKKDASRFFSILSSNSCGPFAKCCWRSK